MPGYSDELGFPLDKVLLGKKDKFKEEAVMTSLQEGLVRYPIFPI